MQGKLVAALVFAFVVVVFAVFNNVPVQLRFFNWQTGEISMVILVIGAVLFGVVFTAILGWLTQNKLRRQLKQKDTVIRELREVLEETKQETEEQA